VGQCPEINEDGPEEFTYAINGNEENRTLECESWGDPKPTVTWTKDNDVSMDI
jgi:hypothetical protein